LIATLPGLKDRNRKEENAVRPGQSKEKEEEDVEDSTEKSSRSRRNNEDETTEREEALDVRDIGAEFAQIWQHEIGCREDAAIAQTSPLSRSARDEKVDG
jgi:hypothetical protein